MLNKHAIRLTNTIFVTQSLLTAGQIAIITLLAIMAVELSGREAAAGLPSTVLTLSQALTALPLGIVMGRLGRRFGLTLSYSSSALGALLGIYAILQGWFWLLLLSSMFIGAGRAGAEQSRFAAGDMFPEGLRARMMGRVVFAGTIGAILGPLLVGPGTWIAASMSINPNAGAWLVGLVLYGLAALLTFTMLRPEPMEIAASIPDERDDPLPDDDSGRTLGDLLRVPTIQLAVVSMLISQGVMVGLMVITPLHMAHNNYGNGAVSVVIMVHTLGMFGLSSITGILIDRFGPVNTMIAGAATLVVSAVVAPLSATMPFLLTGLFLLGLGWNFGYLAGSSLLSSTLRGAERARMQGASDMFVAGAAALGSFGSGPIFGMGGYVAVAGAGIVITLLFAYTIYLLGFRVRGQVAPVKPQT